MVLENYRTLAGTVDAPPTETVLVDQHFGYEVETTPPILSTNNDGCPLIHELKLAPWKKEAWDFEWIVSPTIDGDYYYTPECPKPNTLYKLERPAFEILLQFPYSTEMTPFFEVFYCEKLETDQPPRIEDLKFRYSLTHSNYLCFNRRWFQYFYYRPREPELVKKKIAEKTLHPRNQFKRVEGAPFRIEYNSFGNPSESPIYGLWSSRRFYGTGLPHERNSMARRGTLIERIGALESNRLYHAYADILLLKDIPGTATELFYCNKMGIERYPRPEELKFKKCIIGKDRTVKLESVWYFYILEREPDTKL